MKTHMKHHDIPMKTFLSTDSGADYKGAIRVLTKQGWGHNSFVKGNIFDMIDIEEFQESAEPENRERMMSLLTCDRIVFLNNWRTSKQSLVDIVIAEYAGMPMYELQHGMLFQLDQSNSGLSREIKTLIALHSHSDGRLIRLA